MKRGTPGHIKTKRLARALGIPHYAAVGVLESLFHLAMSQAKAGDIGRFSDSEIAVEIGWPSAGRDLVEALLASGWLDPCPCHRLRIHDWPDHADQTTARQAAKAGGFLSCYQTLADVSPPADKKKPSVDVDVDVVRAVDVDVDMAHPLAGASGCAPSIPPDRGTYVREVWGAFCRILGRDPEGAPSSAEWHVACGWFDMGLPLGTVLGAITDTLGRSDKKPRALAYLIPAVNEAAERRRKALA